MGTLVLTVKRNIPILQPAHRCRDRGHPACLSREPPFQARRHEFLLLGARCQHDCWLVVADGKLRDRASNVLAGTPRHPK
jgi:hypothetical protein